MLFAGWLKYFVKSKESGPQTDRTIELCPIVSNTRLQSMYQFHVCGFGHSGLWPYVVQWYFFWHVQPEPSLAVNAHWALGVDSWDWSSFHQPVASTTRCGFDQPDHAGLCVRFEACKRVDTHTLDTSHLLCFFGFSDYNWDRASCP